MGEENVVYTYNGILFHIKKEGNSDTCYNMENSEDTVLSDTIQTQEDECRVIPLTYNARLGKFTEQEQVRGCRGLRGRGRSSRFMGQSSVWGEATF